MTLNRRKLSSSPFSDNLLQCRVAVVVLNDSTTKWFYHCMEKSRCCHMYVLGNKSGLLTSIRTSVYQSVFVVSWKKKLFHREFWDISILAENLRSADHNTAPLCYPAASHSQESKECPKLVPKMSSCTHSHTTPVTALMDAESGQFTTCTFCKE